MTEQSVLGCGLYAENEWAELVSYEGDAPSGPLFEHTQRCALCSAELTAFTSLTRHVGTVVAEQRPDREAFVDGVLAAVQQERQRIAERSGPVRAGSTRSGAARPDSARAASTRRGSLSWGLPRPGRVAIAAVVTLFAVLGAGLWSWPWSAGPAIHSTGEVLPGGIIVKATNASGSAGTVRAAALSAHAAATAVTGGNDTGGSDTAVATGRPIRVTLGVQAATSAERTSEIEPPTIGIEPLSSANGPLSIENEPSSKNEPLSDEHVSEGSVSFP